FLFEEMDRYGLTEQLNLIVVSDHGMAELSEDKVIFLDDLINLEDVDMIDWTPVAMIRPDEGKTEEIYNTLKENEENYTVYMRDDLPERFRFSNHYRIPEIIMIADMSYSITSHSFFEERGLIAGTHGYDNDTPEMHTFMAASGPAFKSGARTGPVNAVDIYDLIAYIMEIEPAENDGSLENVRELLR
ncbi:MAG: alkaline phosphatase family protein, partial [Balneolaceae bacterium]|nr:alkaline phosphatase family protein [Balneolaceae bacterium]